MYGWSVSSKEACVRCILYLVQNSYSLVLYMEGKNEVEFVGAVFRLRDLSPCQSGQIKQDVQRCCGGTLRRVKLHNQRTTVRSPFEQRKSVVLYIQD